jgi:hypothetical protein
VFDKLTDASFLMQDMDLLTSFMKELAELKDTEDLLDSYQSG